MIFVKNFIKYNMKGHRGSLVKSMANDMKLHGKTKLWVLFGTIYPDIYKEIQAVATLTPQSPHSGGTV
jgi:hypothetical protein